MSKTREELASELEDKVLEKLFELPWDQYIKIAAGLLDVDPEQIEEVFRRAE